MTIGSKSSSGPAGPWVGASVAIVGLGRMGLRHLEAAIALGMKVVGLADSSMSALEEACRLHGVDRSVFFADVGTMLRTTKPDAFVIATTAPSHADYVLEAASLSTRFVLCEKPMAVSLAQADMMIEACERSGTALAVNHQMRFLPAYTVAKDHVGTEELGELSSVIVAGSNVGLSMNGSHFFEAFRFVTGSPVTRIQAWLDSDVVPNPRGQQFEDRSGRVLLWNDSGQSMFIDCSANAGHGLQMIYIYRNGALTFDALTGVTSISARKAEFRSFPTTRYGMPADVRSFAVDPGDTVQATVDVWRSLFAKENYPSGIDGRQAIRCVVAAHVSSERGGAMVSINEHTLPRDRVFPWA